MNLVEPYFYLNKDYIRLKLVHCFEYTVYTVHCIVYNLTKRIVLKRT